MSDDHFISVANSREIQANKVYCFNINDTAILLCKVNDEYYAVHNKCTHADATFDKGRLRSHKLLCPLHGAIFDVRDGSVLSPPAFQALQTYEVITDGAKIKVKIAD